MTVLEKCAFAQEQYERARCRTLVSGGLKYLATDGKICLEVDADYVPENDEIVVFRFDTRNMQTTCRLHERKIYTMTAK